MCFSMINVYTHVCVYVEKIGVDKIFMCKNITEDVTEITMNFYLINNLSLLKG